LFEAQFLIKTNFLGGVRQALGGAATGCFSNSHFIWKQMHKAGAITGDRVWRLPLWKYYSKKVTGMNI